MSDINQFHLKRDVLAELLKVAQGIQGSSEHGWNMGNTGQLTPILRMESPESWHM